MPPAINISDVYETFTTTFNNRNRYQVRPMHESDITTVISIEQITWKKESWRSKDFLEALDDQSSNCWILESNTNDYIVLGYGLQVFSNGKSHIINFCIHPNRRGHGLGRILLRHMIDYARENNASTIELEVHTTNMHAYTLYFNHGFRIFRFLPQYYSENADGYHMILEL